MHDLHPRSLYDAMQKQPVPCELCGSWDLSEIVDTDRFEMGVRSVMCMNCGFAFTNPRPTDDEMQRFYREHYRRFYFGHPDPATEVHQASDLRQTAIRRAQWLFDFCHDVLAACHKPNVLDVGCGEGAFLEIVRQQMPLAQLYGCEPDAAYGDYARRCSGATVFTEGVEQFLQGHTECAGSFDLIVLSHVLEHLCDPVARLASLRNLLGPDGVLCVEVPDLHSPFARGLGKYHIAHLLHFSERTLQSAFTLAGFETVKMFNKEHPVDKWAMTWLCRKAQQFPAKVDVPRQNRTEIERLLGETRARALHGRSLAGPSLRKMTVAERDHWAWQAICEWPRHAGVDLTYRGVDFAELTRHYLWDKVGRAIRREVDPAAFELEQDLLTAASEPGSRQPAQSAGPKPSAGYHGQIDDARQRGRQMTQAVPGRRAPPDARGPLPSRPDGKGYRLRLERFVAGRRVLLMPSKPSRFVEAVRELQRCGRFAIVADYAPQTLPDCLPLPKARVDDRDEAKAFGQHCHAAALEGLRSQGIELFGRDVHNLRAQMQQQARLVQQAERALALVAPAAVFVPADNYPPVQAYVLLADRMGIPSIVLQHGLDCERYYLDQAYAPYFALWGQARETRYEKESSWQPKMRVTGNPQYDHLSLPQRSDGKGDHWLWVTRPHAPAKCLSPSRTAREGLDIFQALAKALDDVPGSRLVIKPHPCDYTELYRQRIAASALAGRIELTELDLSELLPRAAVVITEDSTAGMEAMFHGKPLVHAHFAASTPTMPFTENGAALPGFGPEQLWSSLRTASDLSQAHADQMLAGQRAFLEKNAGPCDGRATERFLAFVSEITGE